jgi:predicted methyltransferase
MIARLEDPTREFLAKLPKIMDGLPLKPGHTAADIGAGVGVLLEALSGRVGSSGKVVAVEPEAEYIPLIHKRIAKLQEEKKLTSAVSVVHSSETETKCAPSSLDFAWTVESFHHWSKPGDMMQSVWTSLKPGGVFVIAEGIDGPGADWDEAKKQQMRDYAKANNLLIHELTRDSVIRDVTAGGRFKHEGDVNVTSRGFILVFKKVT